MPFTTRGTALMFDWSFSRVATRPAQFYLALCTAASAPTHATKTLSELTEIAAGHGYTAGGYALNPNNTDFPTITENDTRRFTDLGVKDILFSASGGDIPSSGAGALYMVMTTDEATHSARQILWYATFRSVRVVLSGQDLNVTGITARIQGGSVIKTIQRGTITMTTGEVTKTATISSVDTSKSELTFLGDTVGNSGSTAPIETKIRVALTNATTVTATRAYDAGLTGIVSYEVTEWF